MVFKRKGKNVDKELGEYTQKLENIKEEYKTLENNIRELKDSGLRTISEDDLNKVKVAVEIALLSSQENVDLSSPFGEEDENKIIENIVSVSNRTELFEPAYVNKIKPPRGISKKFEKGRTLARIGCYDEAEKIINRLISEKPTKESLVELGYIKGRVRQTGKEIECYEKALKLGNGKYKLALEGLVSAYRRIHDVDNANKYAQQLIKLL